MSSDREVFVGPYRSGKSTRLLEELVTSAVSRDGALKSSLLVVPSARYQRLIKERLLVMSKRMFASESNGRSDSVYSAGQIAGRGFAGLTIAPFYEACRLALAKRGVFNRVIPDAVRPALVSRICRQLNRKGGLKHLDSIIDFRGTHSAVLDLIDEFQRAGLSPGEVLSKLKAQASSESRLNELAEIYREYWTELKRIEYIDNRMLAFQVRECLTRIPEGVRLFDFVAVDGFDRFNKLQLQAISELARLSGVARLTFDYSSSQTLHDPLLLASADLAEARAEGNRTTNLIREYEWKDSSFEELCAYFPPDIHRSFGSSSYLSSSMKVDSVSMSPRLSGFYCADRFLEMDEIARRVKLAVLESGISMSEIVVVVPSLKQYKAAAESAFSGAGVPYFLDEPVKISHLPFTKHLMRMLSLSSEDFSRRKLIDTLSSRFFNLGRFGISTSSLADLDEASVSDGIVGSAERWLAAARNVGIDTGLKRLLDLLTPPQGLNRLMCYISWAEDVLSETILFAEDIDIHDPEFLESFEKSIAQIRNCFASMVQEDSILERRRPTINDKIVESIRASELAREAISSEQSDISQERQSENNEPSLLLDYSSFLSRLNYTIERSNHPPLRPKGEFVTICPVDLVDNRIFSDIYLAGMVEGEFPRRNKSRAFVAPDEIARWISYGVDIVNPRMHPAFETALLRSLLARARRIVCISRPVWEMSGEELIPSFFLESELDKIRLEEVRPFQNSLSSPVSSKNLLSGCFWKGMEPVEASALLSRQLSSPEAMSNLSIAERDSILAESARLDEGIAMARARTQGVLQSTYNGYLVDVVESGALKLNSPRRWSASRLNNYGKCPFRYFVENQLGLEPFREPTASLDPRILGQAYHKALENFYRRVIEKALIIGSAYKTELEPLFLASMTEALDWLSSYPAAKQSKFWEFERKELEFRLLRFFELELERADKEKRPMRAYLVEAAFGLDDESSAPPLKISGGGRDVEIRGIVDRLDIEFVHSENSGKIAPGTIARVVDYKAGSTRISDKEAEAGRNLQLPIYAMAAERSILPAARVSEGLYLSIASGGSIGRIDFTSSGAGRKEKSSIDKDDKSENGPDYYQLTESYVLEYVESILKGDFKVKPSTVMVCNSCPHRSVCRIREISRMEVDENASD